MHKNDDITLDPVDKLVEQEHDYNLANLDKINFKKICENFTLLFARVNTIYQEIDHLKKSNIKIKNSMNTFVQKQQYLQLVHAALAKNVDQLENEYIRKHTLLIEKLNSLNCM